MALFHRWTASAPANSSLFRSTAIAPGETELTVIPWAASATAMLRVSVTMAA